MGASWVVLTRGDRPEDLNRAIASIRNADPDGEVVLVCNGCVDHSGLADRVVASDENLGVPGGRNLGWRAATGDVVVFLDDDARFGSASLDRVQETFEAEPDLAVITFRIEDPDTGATARRHIPRVGASGIDRASDVTAFLGGACAIRRSVLVTLDGFWAELFYSHEETDFSWRAIDAGFRIAYDPETTVLHPADEPRSRHADAVFYSMRNRVFLARKALPVPLGFIHVTIWLMVGLARVRSSGEAGALWRGFRSGFQRLTSERRPIRWPTVWRLTRLGRPPII